MAPHEPITYLATAAPVVAAAVAPGAAMPFPAPRISFGGQTHVSPEAFLCERNCQCRTPC